MLVSAPRQCTSSNTHSSKSSVANYKFVVFQHRSKYYKGLQACLGAAETIRPDVGDRGISFLSPICPAQWRCASTSGNLKDCTGKKIATAQHGPRDRVHTTKLHAFRNAFFPSLQNKQAVPSTAQHQYYSTHLTWDQYRNENDDPVRGHRPSFPLRPPCPPFFPRSQIFLCISKGVLLPGLTHIIVPCQKLQHF